MPTLDERIEILRRANDADGGWINDAELHRLALDLAAERERLLAENKRMREALAGLSNALELPQQRGVLTRVPEALERARAALASEPRA